MKRHLFAFALAMTCALTAAAAPKVGDRAPDFNLQGSDGAMHSLSELRGTPVVLAFFPKAYTGGCTLECKSLRDSDREIRNFDVAYFMASTDTPEDNKGFAEQNNASFPILSDTDHSVSEAYGVLTPSGHDMRWTFYIDADGIISRVDEHVNPRTAGQVLVKNLEELGVPKAGSGDA